MAVYDSGNVSFFYVEGYNSNSLFTIFSNLDAHNGSTDLLTPSFFTVEGFNSNSVFTLFTNKNQQTESIFISTNDSRPKSSFSWR